MDAVLTVVGILLILLGLWDVIHTLLHPGGRGSISRAVLAAVWSVSKLLRHRLGSAVGAAGMVLVIGAWVVMQGLGWALIYLPHLPEGFSYAPGVDFSDYAPLAEALYVSFVTLTTLGYGDVLAIDPWIRAGAPFEALTGFALLTAAMTWFSQIYPPLSRRRALALQLSGMADARYAASVSALDAATLARVLDELTERVADVRLDFEQHAEGFYFREGRLEFALARQLPYVFELLDAAMARPEVGVRLSAARLARALEELGATLRSQYLGRGDSVREVLSAYAADHGHEPRD
ncbi:two pore domain potassium channel family protein [Agrococcus sediminis]|uniref:Two pore domain potassium channel family protein n=1 Tax=Agrococcus sediminis TaxID=2599924 RepID=A0A5M8QJG7_9MICO|nr:potassium channel family protein [Agrococcus sediminis]KAA6436297.1 two pore domain potassium channel family protein [Agrococcus sediminis]